MQSPRTFTYGIFEYPPTHDETTHFTHFHRVARARVPQRAATDRDRLPVISRATHAPHSSWGRG
eukprot:575446-Prymnesium_polylepis.1